MESKIYKLLFNAKQILIAFTLIVTYSSYSQSTTTITYSGAMQTMTLPAGNWGFQCWGGNGGDVTAGPGGGGIGGYSTGSLLLTSPSTVYIFVGGKGGNASGTSSPGGAGGWNGGGGGGWCGKSGGGGGGGTDVCLGGTLTTNRIIVAGGGGGAAYYNQMAIGGNGGGPSGANGDNINSSNVNTIGGGGQGAIGNSPGLSSYTPGISGTNTGAGGGGYSPTGFGQPGTPHGAGGSGGTTAGGATGSGGGGGGGYAGGAGGTQTANAGVGGGGGSGYVGGMTSGTTYSNGQAGFVANADPNGNGRVIVTMLCNISLVPSTTNTLVPFICSGQSVTLTTNAVSNYSWSNGNTTNSAIVVSPTVTTTYSVSGQSTQNCVTSAVITVTVNSGVPSLTLTSSSNTVCLGQSATLTASGGLTYTWTGGVTNGVGFTPSVTQVYTVVGQNGCGNTTSTINIGVGPIPVSIGLTPTVACSNQPVTLSATAAANAYTWMPGNLTASNAIVAPTVTTIYTISVSNGTCVGSGTVNLPVNPVPTVGIVSSATNVICAGASATLTASGGQSYTWTPGNSNNASIVVNPTTTSMYSVAASNSFGCSSGTTTVLQTVGAPTIVLSASSNYICPGTSVTLTASGALTYTWTSPSSNNNNVTVNPTSGTTYTVSGSNSVLCTSSQTVFVDVFNPVITISGNTVICPGKSTNLTGNGADTYQWNGANFSNGNSATYNPTVTTSYTVGTSTFSNGVTCTNNVTFQITVNPKPNIQPSATRSVICKGETATISVTGATTYTWTNGGSGSSFVLNGSAASVMNYSVSGTDANGCVNGAQLTVTISACTSLDKLYSENAIRIYPNPSQGEFTVQSSTTLDLKIMNELGQVIKVISLNENNNYKIEVNGISGGIYFITNEKAGINQKVIIEK